MNLTVEKTLTMLIISVLMLASATTLALQEGTLTREEAIEISRNSSLVRALLEETNLYTLEVHYLNQTKVWNVRWYIHPSEAPSAFAYVVNHEIDGQTGEILHEGTASMR